MLVGGLVVTLLLQGHAALLTLVHGPAHRHVSAPALPVGAEHRPEGEVAARTPPNARNLAHAQAHAEGRPHHHPVHHSVLHPVHHPVHHHPQHAGHDRHHDHGHRHADDRGHDRDHFHHRDHGHGHDHDGSDVPIPDGANVALDAAAAVLLAALLPLGTAFHGWSSARQRTGWRASVDRARAQRTVRPPRRPPRG